jgi:hypothetical protein
MSETTERLDAITARLDAATPGPIEFMEYPRRGGRIYTEEPKRQLIADIYGNGNPVFYANARDDVAYLLDLARKQAAALEAVRELHKDARKEVELWARGHRWTGHHCTHDGEHWPCHTVAAITEASEATL